MRVSYSFALLTIMACTAEPPSSLEQTEAESIALPPRAGWLFGVRCQEDFQNNWAATAGSYGMCTKFINGINGSNLDHVAFYYNLHGAAGYIQTADDTCLECGGADSVDFFMMVTHGSINPSEAGFLMWDEFAYARTGSMRLGDSGRQAKVLATYSCNTLNVADGSFLNRWRGVLDGGLKVILGSYELLYDGNDQKGTELAARLEGGEPVGFAWNEALWYADNDNRPIAVATGDNNSDCANRRQARLSTVRVMPRLQQGEWHYACWSSWN